MDFPKSVTIEACESFLHKINSDRESEALLLPVDSSRYAFGGLSSAIQVINTWARKNNDRALLLRSSRSKDVIAELIQSPHKFSAAMSAKSIGIKGGPSDIKARVYSAAKSAIESQPMNQFGQQRGGLCWFAFVDHSSKGFDRNFYLAKPNAKPEPRQPEQFTAVISSMVRKAMSVVGGAKEIDQDSLDCLGRTFYELFLNTHEHGTRGASRSEWLMPGVRIIYVQAIRMIDEGAKNATEGQPNLREYLAAVSEKVPENGNKRFVEIGIVDSGLGYCDRWLSDRPSAEINGPVAAFDEYQIFKKCFSFRQTSSSKGNKGNGLPVVMDRLTKLGGFMRVRSGHLALYRDFVSSPYRANDDACVFSDWNSSQSAENSITSMEKTSGVAISLLLPLEAKL